MKHKGINFWPALPILILLVATAASRLMAASEVYTEDDGPDQVACCAMCPQSE